VIKIVANEDTRRQPNPICTIRHFAIRAIAVDHCFVVFSLLGTTPKIFPAETGCVGDFRYELSWRAHELDLNLSFNNACQRPIQRWLLYCGSLGG